MLTSTSILGYSQEGLHHTPVSLLLVSKHPMSAMFSLLHTNIVGVSESLPSYFDKYGRREPVGVNHLPITYHEGKPELKYFELVNEDPKRMNEFMKAMSITNTRVPSTGVYDMTTVLSSARTGHETVWVDVGGGGGHTVKDFVREYGHEGLKASQCVVHDLADVVEGAKKAAQDDDILKDVRFLPLDFHRESPIKGKPNQTPPMLYCGVSKDDDSDHNTIPQAPSFISSAISCATTRTQSASRSCKISPVHFRPKLAS